MKCIYDIIQSFFSKQNYDICNKNKRNIINIQIYYDVLTL